MSSLFDLAELAKTLEEFNINSANELRSILSAACNSKDVGDTIASGEISPQNTQQINDIRETLVLEVGLSTRAYNALTRHGITTLSDLAAFLGPDGNFEQMGRIRNLGDGTIEEIRTKLEARGLTSRAFAAYYNTCLD